MKYTTENKMSINFIDRNNPLPAIKLKLETRKFDPSKRYVALYLSPHSKWTRDKQLKLIYYQLKEMLLSYIVR